MVWEKAGFADWAVEGAGVLVDAGGEEQMMGRSGLRLYTAFSSAFWRCWRSWVAARPRPSRAQAVYLRNTTSDISRGRRVKSAVGACMLF